jgi:hypothetical protein
MGATAFSRCPSQLASQDERMDVLAIAVALATFAILIGLIYAIDRI